MMNLPILVITYNRPELTQKLVEFLNQQKELNLFVFCDGPKSSTDAQKVSQVRLELSKLKHIFKKNFQEKNLGCQKGVETAIDWIFKKNDRAVILEDDVIVDSSFFQYAEVLLNKFKNDNRIMMISANNYKEEKNYPYSYSFSRQSSGWGWATWKRVWNQYHQTKSLLNIYELEKNILFLNQGVRVNFPLFVRATKKEIDSWGYIWRFSLYVNNGLCIYPHVNLAINNGFGKDATHTKQISDHAYLKKKPISFPLKHPPFIFPNEKYDSYIKRTHSLLSILLQVIKNTLLMR